MRFFLFSAAFLAAACSPSVPVGSLTRLTQVSTSAACPTGGVVVASGLDSNADGRLGDDEVKDRKEICNGGAGVNGQDGTNGLPGANGDGGSNGFGSLILTTPLLPGDTNCAEGGVRIDVGLDDGAGGGTARNGTLETGEILSTRFICNGAGERLFPGSVTPPASPAGAFSISTNGGSAGLSSGGSAGSILIASEGGTRGGHVKVFKTGLVDASFTVAASPAFVPGTQALSVSTNTTIVAYPSAAAGITGGNPAFLVDNQPRLFANVAGVAVPVTSLSVAVGVTLTFEPNFGEETSFKVQKDIRNAGTLTTDTLEDGASRGGLSLGASNFYGETGSSINLAAGGDGSGGTLRIDVGALLVNQGTINTSGGNGFNGGDSGAVTLMADPGTVTNAGAITARGGVAANQAGGGGGQVSLTSGYRALRNSGAIDTSGGNGITGGGQAGSIRLDPRGLGLVLNTGNLTAVGGACTFTTCSGGNGGPIFIGVTGGELRNSGNLDASGGAGGAAGGHGAVIKIECTDNQSNLAGAVVLPTGSMFVSGNLVTNGGAGAAGGTGGTVLVTLGARNLPFGQEVTLLGYTQLSANGGTSTNANGGNGGPVQVKNTNTSGTQTFDFDEPGPPCGAAINYADVSSKGGDGTGAGAGGDFIMTASAGINHGNPWEYSHNFAATIDVRGGQGSTFYGGRGGTVSIYGQARAENNAAVNGNGGNASSSPLHSGAGGLFELGSDLGAVTNTGAVQLNSGTSSGNADPGGEARLSGTAVTNSGNISCNGGNATTSGGQGGTIELLSAPTGASINTGTFSVSGGNGANPGARGSVTIDGNDATP